MADVQSFVQESAQWVQSSPRWAQLHGADWRSKPSPSPLGGWVGGLDAAHWRQIVSPPVDEAHLVGVCVGEFWGIATVVVTRVRRSVVTALDAPEWSAAGTIDATHAIGGGAEFAGGAKVARRNWARVAAQEAALLSHLLSKS